MKEERIVLDTNCLLQILPRKSGYNHIWADILAGNIRLCVCNDMIMEYTEILTNHVSWEVADNVITVILHLPGTIFVHNYYKWNAITSDPDDNKFVDCAFAAQAKFLVSNDSHFNEVKRTRIPDIEIIRLDEYDNLKKSP
ncbi:MAG: putative toxin-antitoxin system toxin component, PIN family [Bacteroidales bacterium]|nr:putative toxin-antitoxin system toxin component, PIN family [Bacteroidales bacterium]